MALRLGVGGVDDHLTPNKSQVPFDPNREEGNTKEIDKIDELSKALFQMIHGDLMALSNIGIQGLPQSQDDLRKRLEIDPNFTIIALLMVNMKRDVAGLHGSITQLAQRVEGIGSSVRELNDRTADIKSYGM